jgi:hypothetical protein
MSFSPDLAKVFPAKIKQTSIVFTRFALELAFFLPKTRSNEFALNEFADNSTPFSKRLFRLLFRSIKFEFSSRFFL